jgi:hypothetical protein
MRSPIQRKVVTQFTRQMQERCARFQRRKPELIWAWKTAPGLTLFVLLQPFPKADQFALELAWSNDDEFPWHSLGQTAIKQPSGRARFPCWEGNTKEHIWDLAPEATAALDARLEAYGRGESPPYVDSNPPVDEVMPKVESAVADASERLLEIGLPFLRRVADAHGLAWE